MKKIIFLLCLNIGFCVLIKAQENTSVEAVVGLLKQMRADYDNISNLSFDVSYTYAKQSTPDKILDSLSGRMQVSNKQYHWNISNTEMIANSKYVIMLFKEDKLMYITRPGSQNINFDPLSRLDSSLFLLKGLQCSLENKKDITTVTLNFPDSSAYKQIKMTINRKNGFLSNTKFIIRPGAVRSFEDFDSMDNTGDEGYNVIEARYYNYNQDSISAAIFNSENYFNRSGTEFVAANSYSDYKIFIGSPNL